MQAKNAAAILREGAAKIRALNKPSIVVKSDSKPSFKPNTHLGERISAHENLDYRQQLLNLLKNVYNDFQKIKKSTDSPDNKIKQVDKLIDNYITEGNSLIEKSITQAYNDGVKYASDKLKKIGAKAPKLKDNPERLQSIIRQQQMNHEDAALTLRGRLRQLINVSDVMGYYGNK